MLRIKKVVAMALALSLALSISVFAYESETNSSSDVNNLINDALAQIEPYKASFGYADIDFGSLEVGAPISAYDLYENGLVFSRKIYPLFEDDTLVLLGLEVYDGDYTYIQITQGLVEKLNEIVPIDKGIGMFLFVEDWDVPLNMCDLILKK